MSFDYALNSYDAVPANIMRSLGGWVHGTMYATYSGSGATVKDSSGTALPWNQHYSTSPAPIIKDPFDVEVDISRKLREEGSPVLVFDNPRPRYPTKRTVGDSFVHQEIGIIMTMHVDVWDGSSRNIGATKRQFDNATEKMMRLLQFRNGHFPIYDYAQTPPQENQIGQGQICNINEPVQRTSGPHPTAVFSFAIKVPRDCE